MPSDKEKKNQKEESLSIPSTIIQPQVDSPTAGNDVGSLVASENENIEAELSGSPKDSPSAPKGPKFLQKLLRQNTYIFVFGILIVVAAGATFAALRLVGDDDQNSNRTQSLTDQEIAALKGNTTLVGDSKQILDVQSNSIFQGQVLIRKDLDVAGSIKVGGPLSLSGVAVGGTSTFNEVVINSTLSVAGNSTFQSPVNMQRNLSVAGGLSVSGTLSAGTLNVTKLQLTGDLGVVRHIATSGGVPGRSAGTAVGGGGTVSVNGTDTAGTITINTGSGPPAGNLITVNFTAAYGSTPHVVVSPVGSAAAGLNYYVTKSSTSFTLATTNAPPASSSFSFDYIVFE